MHGRLFTLLGQGFPSYFVLLIVGFTLAALSGSLWVKRTGQDPDVVVDLSLAMLIASTAGARLLHVFADGFFWDYVHLCTDPSKVDWHLDRAQCLSPDYNGVWDAARSVCKPEGRDCFAWARFYAGGLAYYGGFLGASLAAWYLLRADRATRRMTAAGTSAPKKADSSQPTQDRHSHPADFDGPSGEL